MDNRHGGKAALLWDRRDVLKAASAAVSAAAGSAIGANVVQAAPDPHIPPLYKIVADARFAECRAFAAEAARAGQQIAWIDGDITNFWYDDLDLHWRDDTSSVAGMTKFGAFFCLERLALDRGLRVSFKGEHRRLANGMTSHVLTGSKDLMTRPALERMSDRAWATQAARMIMATPGQGVMATHFRARSMAGPEQPPLLISWVLAAKSERRNVGDVA